jgi:hypothetical protein
MVKNGCVKEPKLDKTERLPVGSAKKQALIQYMPPIALAMAQLTVDRRTKPGKL